MTYMPRGATLTVWVRVQGTAGNPRVQSTSGFSAVLVHEDPVV